MHAFSHKRLGFILLCGTVIPRSVLLGSRAASQVCALSPSSWTVGNWSACSRTCGGGTQSRQVQCTRRARYDLQPVVASLCPQPAPPSQQACNPQGCPPAWSTGPWAEVSGQLPAGRAWAHWLGQKARAFALCAVLPDLWQGLEEEDPGLQEHQPLSPRPAAARSHVRGRAQAQDTRGLPAPALPQTQEAAVAGVRLVPGGSPWGLSQVPCLLLPPPVSLQPLSSWSPCPNFTQPSELQPSRCSFPSGFSVPRSQVPQRMSWVYEDGVPTQQRQWVLGCPPYSRTVKSISRLQASSTEQEEAGFLDREVGPF